MIWHICIQYANGTERVLKSYRSRETAVRCIDAIYSQFGYPLHVAYVLRHTQRVQLPQAA